MEIKTFQHRLKTLISQRNCLALCVIALSLAITMLSFTLQNKGERVVIIPTTGSSFWIEKSRASKEYLSAMGVFLADLLLTRTPADIAWKNEQVLCHVHPSSYVGLKKALFEEKEKAIHSQSTFLFETLRSYPIEKKLQFVIEGNQKIYIEKPGKKETLLQSQKLRYILSFRCEEGRLYLVNLSQEKL